MAKQKKAHDLLKLLREIVDQEQLVWRYMHCDCQVWKAIRDHVCELENNLIVHPVGSLIPSYRGTGPGISYRGVGLYAKDYSDPDHPKEASVFRLKLAINYVDEDNRNSNVPTKLLDFKQHEFQAWLTEMGKKKKTKQLEEDRASLKAIAERSPSLLGEIRERQDLQG